MANPQLSGLKKEISMLRKIIFAVTTVVALAVIALAPTSAALAFGGQHFSNSGHLWFFIGTVVLPALAFIVRRWFGLRRQEQGGRHTD
jgi:hypothetical protein